MIITRLRHDHCGHTVYDDGSGHSVVCGTCIYDEDYLDINFPHFHYDGKKSYVYISNKEALTPEKFKEYVGGLVEGVQIKNNFEAIKKSRILIANRESKLKIKKDLLPLDYKQCFKEYEECMNRLENLVK